MTSCTHSHFFASYAFCNFVDSKHSICLYTPLFSPKIVSADKYKKLVGVRVSGGDLCEAEAPTEATAETTTNPLTENLAFARLKSIMKKPLCNKNTTANFYIQGVRNETERL